MATQLTILALLVAAGACVLAWRARRGSIFLALEMIQLRDRLAVAEEGRLAAEEAAALSRSPAGDSHSSLLPRVLALESQLRAAVSARPQAGRDPGADPRVHVRTQLERRGFAHVSILGAADDGRYLVEAERRGVVSKGHAEIAPDGTVHWRSMSSLRAFP